MDALMAALVAAFLATASERTPWLAAILGDRFGRRGPVIAGAALALLAINVAGAIGGTLIVAHMSRNARDLLFGVALLSAGVTALLRLKTPDRLDGWRIGPFATALFGLTVLGFGSGMQFLTVAIAARSGFPVLAAIGATIGALAVTVPAALAGERARRALPIRPLRTVIGVLFLIAGAVLALGAMRLI